MRALSLPRGATRSDARDRVHAVASAVHLGSDRAMKRWLAIAVVVACRHADHAGVPAAPGELPFECFAWHTADDHGTRCARRGACESLRRTLADPKRTDEPCTGIASVYCYSLDAAPVDACFATDEECRVTRAAAAALSGMSSRELPTFETRPSATTPKDHDRR